MENKGWQITFSDMLTLMLTFFVFLISISVFKTEDYQRFWKNYNQLGTKKAAGGKPSIELIKGINPQNIPPDVEQILDNFVEVAAESDFSGAQIYYDESRVSLIISEELGFKPASAELNPRVRPLLQNFANQLRQVGYEILIEGHSDDRVASGVDNLELSFRRAQAIADLFFGQQISAQRIVVSGYGPYRPIFSNATPEGRARNRRVEINLIIKKEV